MAFVPPASDACCDQLAMDQVTVSRWVFGLLALWQALLLSVSAWLLHSVSLREICSFWVRRLALV